MTKMVKRIVLLLSDPSLSDDQFAKLGAWLSGEGTRYCLDQAREVRRVLRKTSQLKNLIAGADRDPLEKELRRLLLVEANLTVKEALRLLAESVSSPPPSYESFSRGLSQIRTNANEICLLNAAQEIRNRSAHNLPVTQWPLKEPPSDKPEGST